MRLQIIDFGFSFSLFFSVQKGLGLHSTQIRPEDELAFNKANYAFTVLYVSTNGPLFHCLPNNFPEPGVNGRQDLDPCLLPDLDTKPESLSMGELCHPGRR